MPESLEIFLSELNNRYPVDDRFRRNIRPLVERIFDQSISRDERKRLLNLVEQTYKRQVENRENLERAKDGIRKIFSNLYKRILKDLGPQMKNLQNRLEEQKKTEDSMEAEPGKVPQEPQTGDNETEDNVKPGGLHIWEPKPLKPQDPVWGQKENEEDAGSPDNDPIPRQKDLLFGEFLVGRGALDRNSLLGALEEQIREKPLIGWVGLRRGILDENQVLKVLERQVREERRFGEIAVEEGFLNPDSLDMLRRVQKKYTPLLGKVLVNRGDLSSDALKYFLEEFNTEYGKN